MSDPKKRASHIPWPNGRLVTIRREYFDETGTPKETARRIRKREWNALVEELCPDGSYDPSRANLRREDLNEAVHEEEQAVREAKSAAFEVSNDGDFLGQANMATYGRELARYRLQLIGALKKVERPIEPIGSFSFKTETRRDHAYDLVDAWNDSDFTADTQMSDFREEVGQNKVNKVGEELKRGGFDYEHGNPASFVAVTRKALQEDESSDGPPTTTHS